MTFLAPRSFARAGAVDRRTLITAAASAVVLAGIVGVISWRHSRTTGKPSIPTGAVPAAPDIRGLPVIHPGGDAVAGAAVGKGSGFFAQFVDQGDPTRLAGEITSTRSTPLPDRRHELEEPRAWFFQRNGKTIHVQARHGRVTMPSDGGRPTDGSLEGDVRIRVYAKSTTGARPDLGKDSPELDATTTRISADWILGQLDAPEALKATGHQGFFHGRGLTVEFDPSTQRVDQVHVASLVEPVLIRPATKSARAVAPAAPPDPGSPVEHTPPPRAGADAATAEPEEERFYTLRAVDNVEIKFADRTATAQSLLGWGRTVGGRIALESAPGPVATPEVHQGHPASTANHPQTSAQVPAHGAPPESDALTLWWTGPLQVSRIEQRPSELARDDALIRLDSPTGQVTLTDAKAGTSGEGTRLDYAASREVIYFAGRDGMPAWVDMATAGRASAQLFELDVPAAEVRIPGAGKLAGIAQVPSTDSTQTPAQPTAVSSSGLPGVSWSERAEFKFDSLRESRASLTRALMIGSVEGLQGDLRIAGDTANAEFFPATDFPDGARNVIRRVQLIGRASAKDGVGGEFRGDTLSVQFSPEVRPRTPAQDAAPPRSVARRIEAVGNAFAARSGDSLEAKDSIAAELKPDDVTGNAKLEAMAATGGFLFKSADGAVGSGSTLNVQANDQLVNMTGSPASLSRNGAVLRSSSIALNGEKQTLIAEGPGDFSRASQEGNGSSTEIENSSGLEASWTRSMTINDREGLLTVDGDARVASRATVEGGTEVTSIHADSVRVNYQTVKTETSSPPEAPPPSAPDAHGEGRLVDDLAKDLDAERRVLRAEAASDPTPASAPVRVEVVRTDAGAHEPGRVMYIEGQRIIADSAANTVTVPTAGKLLNSDRRPDLAQVALPGINEPLGATPTFTGSSRGDALFAWNDSAVMNLTTGLGTLHGSVRMIHRRASDGALTQLKCDRLDTTSTDVSGDRALASVDAEGGVWAQSDGRELTGDRAHYAADTSIMEALALPGSRVIISDPRSGEPLNAQAVRWNLRTGRIEVIDPSSMTAPR